MRPGDLLAALVRWLGLAGDGARMCDLCERRRAAMNAWGWRGCLQRQGLISSWLTLEVSMRGYTRVGPQSRRWLALLGVALVEMARMPRLQEDFDSRAMEPVQGDGLHGSGTGSAEGVQGGGKVEGPKGGGRG